MPPKKRTPARKRTKPSTESPGESVPPASAHAEPDPEAPEDSSQTTPGSKPTRKASEKLGHTRPETQIANAEPPPSAKRDTQTHSRSVEGGESFYGLIVILADAVSDLESARIAAQGRARALRQEKGLPDLAVRQEALVAALERLERDSIKELEKTLASTSIGAWIKKTHGLGFKGVARLLGAIGNPHIRAVSVEETEEIELHERTVSQLWAYCGYHVVNGKRPRPRRGVQSNWNTEAKQRAFLLADACVKQRKSPYRAVYDQERERWAERDTTDGHKHNHAMSVTAKAILKDLWVVSKA